MLPARGTAPDRLVTGRLPQLGGAKPGYSTATDWRASGGVMDEVPPLASLKKYREDRIQTGETTKAQRKAVIPSRNRLVGRSPVLSPPPVCSFNRGYSRLRPFEARGSGAESPPFGPRWPCPRNTGSHESWTQGDRRADLQSREGGPSAVAHR
jgi:hypothetical protein